MLDDTQIATLQDYVAKNPDRIPEFGTPPQNGWDIATNPVVRDVMNTPGKVADQTLDREFMPVVEFWDCIAQTRASAVPPHDDYATRTLEQRTMLSDLLTIFQATGVPLDDQLYPNVDAKVKWIFEGATDTLQNLQANRTRDATPAEDLFGVEGIIVLEDDARAARRLDAALRSA